MNLDDIAPDLLMTRGEYATVRSEHENAKSRIAALCGALSSLSAGVLRACQPDNDAPPDMGAIGDKIDQSRLLVERIYAEAIEIAELAAQRADLKGKAWPKPPR